MEKFYKVSTSCISYAQCNMYVQVDHADSIKKISPRKTCAEYLQ